MEAIDYSYFILPAVTMLLIVMNAFIMIKTKDRILKWFLKSIFLPAVVFIPILFVFAQIIGNSFPMAGERTTIFMTMSLLQFFCIVEIIIQLSYLAGKWLNGSRERD